MGGCSLHSSGGVIRGKLQSQVDVAATAICMRRRRRSASSGIRTAHAGGKSAAQAHGHAAEAHLVHWGARSQVTGGRRAPRRLDRRLVWRSELVAGAESSHAEDEPGRAQSGWPPQTKRGLMLGRSCPREQMPARSAPCLHSRPQGSQLYRKAWSLPDGPR